MTDAGGRPEIDPDDVDFARELGGDRPLDDQVAYLPSDTLAEPEPLTDTELDEGEPDIGRSSLEGLGLLEELDLRPDETDDPNVAAEEGLAYVPPIDPPVVPSDAHEGVDIAAGFGASALDEPYDDDHGDGELSAESELVHQVHDALRADAGTSRWADQIVVGTRGDMVVLRGQVDDVDDSDDVAAVVARVDGVGEVIDEIEVRALG